MNDFGTLLVIIAVVALSLRVGYAFSQAPSPNLGATAQQTRPEPVIIRYQGGELAIDAYNAPLDDILRAVCQQTGALIDVPQEATERVTRQIGPGRVIEVLGSLLNESNFNYLIEELGVDKYAPVRVTLSSKTDHSRVHRPIEALEAKVAMAATIAPEVAEARQVAVAERSELLRIIMDERGRTMDQSMKDKEGQ